jgi:hypothetical protein
MGYKWVIVAAGLLVGGIEFGYAHYYNVEEYESKLTFAIEEKSGGRSLMGLASQFGVDIGVAEEVCSPLTIYYCFLNQI